MAAAWFFVRGVMSIMDALNQNKQGAGAVITVIHVTLGVLELILGCYSLAHPAVLALSIGILIGFYFIESGFNTIFIGAAVSNLAAVERALQNGEDRAE